MNGSGILPSHGRSRCGYALNVAEGLGGPSADGEALPLGAAGAALHAPTATSGIARTAMAVPLTAKLPCRLLHMPPCRGANPASRGDYTARPRQCPVHPARPVTSLDRGRAATGLSRRAAAPGTSTADPRPPRGNGGNGRLPALQAPHPPPVSYQTRPARAGALFVSVFSRVLVCQTSLGLVADSGLGEIDRLLVSFLISVSWGTKTLAIVLASPR